jgi:hypothetical protein
MTGQMVEDICADCGRRAMLVEGLSDWLCYICIGRERARLGARLCRACATPTPGPYCPRCGRLFGGDDDDDE